MAALASLDDVIAKMTGANERDPLNVYKTDRIAGAVYVTIALVTNSYWEVDGFPSGGVAPGAVVAPDNTTDGSFKQPDPGGGRQLWLTAVALTGNQGRSVYILYDRLLHVGGLSGTVTTPQLVGGAITRYTGAESYDNEVWVELSVPLGVTGAVLTVNYIDENGNAVTGSVTLGGGVGSNLQARMYLMTPAIGSLGCSSITSVQLGSSTGTAGSFAVIIARQLLAIPVWAQNTGGLVDMVQQITEIKPGACLALMAHSTSAVPAKPLLNLTMVES